MPTGLQIINDNGSVIIDENYPSLALRSKGTITASLNSGLYTATFTTTADLPVVAFYSASGPCAIMTRSVSGSSWTFKVCTLGAYQIEWYLFDKPQYAAGSGVGLQVFDASGVCTYNSIYPSSLFLGMASYTSAYIKANGNMAWTTSASFGGGTNKLGVIFGDVSTAGVIIDDYGTAALYRLAFQNLGPGSLQFRMGRGGVAPGTPYPPSSGFWWGAENYALVINLDGL